MLALHALALLAAAAEPSAPPAARTFSAAPESTLTFRLVHPFHTVVGVCRAVEAKARFLPDGTVQVAARARVDSFDSGNSNRDAHALEVVEADRLPFVTFHGTAEAVRVASFPAELDVPLRGTLDFHGVTEELTTTAHARFPSPDRFEVEVRFPISLTAHRVERPSLLFVKVADRLDLTARLSLALEPP